MFVLVFTVGFCSASRMCAGTLYMRTEANAADHQRLEITPDWETEPQFRILVAAILFFCRSLRSAQPKY